MTMLSYMIPMDESKPPIGSPVAKDRLELVLDAEPVSISKDTSINSFASTDTTATLSHSSMTPTSFSDNKAKTKVIVNGSKHQTLKR